MCPQGSPHPQLLVLLAALSFLAVCDSRRCLKFGRLSSGFLREHCFRGRGEGLQCVSTKISLVYLKRICSTCSNCGNCSLMCYATTIEPLKKKVRYVSLIWDDSNHDQDQWFKITRITVRQKNRQIPVDFLWCTMIRVILDRSPFHLPLDPLSQPCPVSAFFKSTSHGSL